MHICAEYLCSSTIKVMSKYIADVLQLLLGNWLMTGTGRNAIANSCSKKQS